MATQLRIELPRPHSAQQQVLSQARRFNVLACGRRWGKSTLGIDRVVKPALSGFPCGWFAPAYKLQAEVYRDLQKCLAPVITARNNAEFRLEIRGGGSVTMFSLDSDVSDSVRGRAFKTVVVDEAALVHSLRAVFETAIRPTLADYLGDAWFLSTPRGLNDFKAFFDRGQDPGKEDWASWQMPTSTNPHIAGGEIQAARQDMTEAAFAQEFLAQFVNWEGAVFRHVQECATAERTDGPEIDHEYVIGCDWGRAHDYTVFVVMDVTTRAMVQIDRSNQVDYVVQRGRLRALYDHWQPSKIIAESNSIGEPIIEELKREGLPVQPFATTHASKAGIIEALALAFEQGSIRILDEPVLLGELQAFAAEQLAGGTLRYAAPAGQHDDTVMSLALAWSVFRSGAPFGFLDYLQELRDAQAVPTNDANLEARIQATAQRLARLGVGGPAIQSASASVPTNPKAPASACPECNATCITPLTSGGKRCGACGWQWDEPGVGVQAPTRGGVTGAVRSAFGGPSRHGLW